MKVGVNLLLICGTLLWAGPVLAQREGNARHYHVWMAALPLGTESRAKMLSLVDDLKRQHATELEQTATALGCKKIILASQVGPERSWLLFRTECKEDIQSRLFERAAPDWYRKLTALATFPTASAVTTLFDWDDDALAEGARGQKFGIPRAVHVTAAQAATLKQLTAEMRSRYLGGLIKRARWVPYYKENMHLQEQPDGALFLLYLEMPAPMALTRVVSYPDDEFTRWWNPKFSAALAPEFQERDIRNELLFNWEAP